LKCCLSPRLVIQRRISAIQRLILIVLAKRRRATHSCSCVPARSCAWNNPAPTERIFGKFYVWKCFEKLARKFKFHWNLARI